MASGHDEVQGCVQRVLRASIRTSGVPRHGLPRVVQSLYLYYLRRDEGMAGRVEEERRLKEILSALPAIDADWIVDRLAGRAIRRYTSYSGG